MKTINQTTLLKSIHSLIAAAMVAALPAVAGAASGDFVVLDNPGDPNFNQLLGINNNERSRKIVGFYVDANTGVTHGFLDANGVQMAVDDPQGSAPTGFVGYLGGRYFGFEAEIDGMKVTSTQVFGCNNNGGIVGQVTDSAGDLHGFVYREGRFHQFDAPGSSQVPQFGVQGTLINGINDFGDIVGFFSDGVSKVKSFVRYADE